MVQDCCKQIEEDVRDIKDWMDRHEEAHTADTELLASIVKTLSNHQENHHGRASTIKQGGALAGALTLLYALVEIARQFFL